jgi:hypothetical protein
VTLSPASHEREEDTTMSITTTILFSLFLSQSPDVCSVPYPETGRGSLYCDPVRYDDAPKLDFDVCCDGDSCVPAPPTAAGCGAGKSRYYAEYGKVSLSGEVWPMFSTPDWCDLHPCPTMEFTPGPLAEFMCCQEGDCYEYHIEWMSCNPGEIIWCWTGVCNDDGTVSCLDETPWPGG